MAMTFGIIGSILLIALLSGVRILKEYERGVVFRLGKCIAGVKGPGLVLIIPFGIDQLVRVDLRVITMDIPTQDVITRDNVSVKVNGVLYFQVLDARKAILEVEQFYYATDGPLLRDSPDILNFEEALSLDTGDTIRVTCGWTNTTDHALSWPEEMCVALMYYSPGRGFLSCDTDDKAPAVHDGETLTEGCVPPGYEGNAKGVGKHCTVGGGECADTEATTLCLAEFDDRANYCSIILCLEDDECGADASCVEESAGTACVPLMCQ